MDIVAFRKQLIDYLDESGVSQNELSKQAKVPQSQISDWVNGIGKYYGKNPRKVMKIIESYRISDDVPISENVVTAVREFCEGNDERSEILAQIILSLKPLIVQNK